MFWLLAWDLRDLNGSGGTASAADCLPSEL